MRQKILVADDDYILRDLLKDILEKEGFEVLEAEDGIQALSYFKSNPDISLVLADIMMPGKDGLEVLEEIRGSGNTPVILLTALGDSRDEVAGFSKGACDYITKPFHREILLARIRAALTYKSQEEAEDSGKWTIGNLEVNLIQYKVSVSGKEVVLTNKEYQLLLYLIENRNIVLTRDQMLDRIWGFDYEGDIRTIDTHIKMLRKDLGECGNYIQTVKGVGYCFREETV